MSTIQEEEEGLAWVKLVAMEILRELKSVFILKKKPKGFNDGLDRMSEKKEDTRGSEFGLSG